MKSIFRILKLYKFFLCFLLAAQTISSQQLPMFRQLLNNPYFYNPAYTGSTDYIYLLTDYREQWADLEGSPESITVSADIPVKVKKIGVGINLFSDRVNFTSNNYGFVTYSYKIRINEKHGLALGLSGGIIRNQIHRNKINTEDTEGEYINPAKSKFDANLGILYNFLGYKFGFAAYQLLGNEFKYKLGDDPELKYSLVRHYNLSFSYQFKLPQSLTVDPLIILWDSEGLPAQIDVGANFNWGEKYWVNCAYRHNYGVTIGLGGYFYNRFTLGYSYDISTTNIGPYAGRSHEVTMGIRLYANDKKALYPNEEYSGGDSKNLREITQKQFENIDKLKAENKKLKEELESTNSDIKDIKEEISRLKKTSLESKISIDEAIDKYSIELSELEEEENYEDGYIADNQDTEDKLNRLSTDSNSSDANDNNSFSGTKEIRTKNNKYYIVVGAYLKLSDAKEFQNILKKEIKLETKIITREDGKFIFVYTKKAANAKEAKSEINRLKNLDLSDYISGNIWIFSDKQYRNR